MSDPQKMRNFSKGTLISHAIRRIRRAIREGFYIEAVSLADSLITNRMNAVASFSVDGPFKENGVKAKAKKLNGRP